MNHGKTIIGVVVAFALGALLGYYAMPTKTVEITKEVQVVKYIKAQKIEQKPDGTIIATGDATLADNSHTSEWSQTKINEKSFMIMPLIAISQDNKGFGLMAQKDFIGPIGLGVGGMVTTSRQLYGMVGVSLRF